MKGLGLGLGLGALGLLGLAVALRDDEPELAGKFTKKRALHRRTLGERRQPMEWIDRVIERVSEHEGRYDSLNRNTDGAGLSFGILQWAQKTGDLGTLLAAMQRADGEAFVRIFGPRSGDLVATVRKPSLASVDGAVLWREPWIGRFKEAGDWPVFQAVQRRMARDGAHFQGALEVSRALGVATERAMALFFDTAVQQGRGAAVQIGQQVKDRYARAGRTTVPYDELLQAYAQRAADRLRTGKEPTTAPRATHLRWEKVGAEWHLFAGTIDLYRGVYRRRFAILADQRLEDAPVVMV